MAYTRSDNRVESHPKPVQEYERQQTSLTWADWPDFTTLTTTLDGVGYTSSFRRNKYFWVAGGYYRCNDDGVTFTQVNSSASGGVLGYKFLVGTGTAPANINAIVAAGNTLTYPALSSASRILSVEIDGVSVYDFGTPLSFTFSGDTIDFTAMGGLAAGNRVVVIAQF